MLSLRFDHAMLVLRQGVFTKRSHPLLFFKDNDIPSVGCLFQLFVFPTSLFSSLRISCDVTSMDLHPLKFQFCNLE